MAKRLLSVVALAVLGACGADDDDGGGSSGGGGGSGGSGLLQVVGACAAMDKAGACSCATWYASPEAATFAEAQFDAGCTGDGFTKVDVCTTENSLGTCEQGGNPMLIVSHLFQNGDTCTGGEADWQAWCESLGGVWK